MCSLSVITPWWFVKSICTPHRLNWIKSISYFRVSIEDIASMLVSHSFLVLWICGTITVLENLKKHASDYSGTVCVYFLVFNLIFHCCRLEALNYRRHKKGEEIKFWFYWVYILSNMYLKGLVINDWEGSTLPTPPPFFCFGEIRAMIKHYIKTTLDHCVYLYLFW